MIVRRPFADNLDVLGAVSLPFVEIGVEKQFAHANDTSNWRTDLVGHVI